MVAYTVHVQLHIQKKKSVSLQEETYCQENYSIQLNTKYTFHGHQSPLVVKMQCRAP